MQFLVLSSSTKGLNWDLNPDLCNAWTVLYKLSYQANWDWLICGWMI